MKMKKCTLKTLCAVLTCTTVLSSLLAVNAADAIITETSMDESSGTGSSDSSWTTEENSFEDIKVTYQQSPSYTVTIPKTIALDTNKQAAYSVKVSGNIDANQRVYVAPVDGIADSENLDFYMNDLSGKKASVVATVTQNKVQWSSEEIANAYEETNNSVSAPNLTAGTWEGTFQVEIRLETEKAHEHHYVDGKCECGAVDPNHTHNYVDGTCTICGEKEPDPYEMAPADAYSNWNYTLDDENNIITLNYYKGAETNVIVYANYVVGEKTYKTQIKSNGDSSTTAAYMFNGNAYGQQSCQNIATIKFSDNIDTSNVTNMRNMFNCCKSLTDIDFGKNFDTSNVTDMENMFLSCKKLTSLDLSAFDTSNVANMKNMFNNCTSLIDIDLNSFYTGNVTNMYGAFGGCSSLTSLDLSSFDASNVKDMTYMFYQCSALKTIYVTEGKWSTSKASTKDMFFGCGTSTVTYK